MEDIQNMGVDLLNLIRKPFKGVPGLKVIMVDQDEKSGLKLKFDGTALALDAAIFEIPPDLYPLKKGDKLLAYPLYAATGAAQRWGLLQKLNGCKLNLATMQTATSLKIDGITVAYTAAELILPSALALQAGDRVVVAPIWDGQLKYTVISKGV